jgi:hypothetical protein
VISVDLGFILRTVYNAMMILFQSLLSPDEPHDLTMTPYRALFDDCINGKSLRVNLRNRVIRVKSIQESGLATNAVGNSAAQNSMARISTSLRLHPLQPRLNTSYLPHPCTIDGQGAGRPLVIVPCTCQSSGNFIPSAVQGFMVS